MSIIGKFKKQPGERLDYEVSYVDFFSERTDAISGAVVYPETGLNLVSTTVVGETVIIVLSEGLVGVKYKITVVMTTTTGIIKEDEFFITVKEI